MHHGGPRGESPRGIENPRPEIVSVVVPRAGQKGACRIKPQAGLRRRDMRRTPIETARAPTILALAERDPTLGQIVRRQLDPNLVPRHDTNEVLPHPPGHVGNHGMTAVECYAKAYWPGPASRRPRPLRLLLFPPCTTPQNDPKIATRRSSASDVISYPARQGRLARKRAVAIQQIFGKSRGLRRRQALRPGPPARPRSIRCRARVGSCHR